MQFLGRFLSVWLLVPALIAGLPDHSAAVPALPSEATLQISVRLRGTGTTVEHGRPMVLTVRRTITMRIPVVPSEPAATECSQNADLIADFERLRALCAADRICMEHAAKRLSQSAQQPAACSAARGTIVFQAAPDCREQARGTLQAFETVQDASPTRASSPSATQMHARPLDTKTDPTLCSVLLEADPRNGTYSLALNSNAAAGPAVRSGERGGASAQESIWGRNPASGAFVLRGSLAGGRVAGSDTIEGFSIVHSRSAEPVRADALVEWRLIQRNRIVRVSSAP